MKDYERRSIERCGFTHDYLDKTKVSIMLFSESSRGWEMFYHTCNQGQIKTYNETYANEPEILEKSDPVVVGKLDQLVEKLIDAGKRRDFNGAREVMRELVGLRK